MRERDVEAYLRERVIATGGACYKFVSPGRRGVPDRLCVWRDGVVAFVEVKAPGKMPTPAQYRELQRLRRMGQVARWLDSKAAVDMLLSQLRRT
jgi:hypothetical protein